MTQICQSIDEEDGAAVITVVLALAGGARPALRTRTWWGDPGRRLGVTAPGPDSWWAAGLPR